MALFNELQVGRYNAILHKLFAMREGAPSPSLATDLSPVIVMENDRPEWKFLANERICVGFVDAPAVAGELAHAQILNLTEGALVVVDHVFLSAGGALGIRGGLLDSAFAGASAPNGGYRDRRLPTGSPVTAAQVRQDTSVASQITTELHSFIIGANTVNRIPLDIVLTPNTGWAFRATTVNVAFRATYVWRERQLEPSETR